MPSDRAPPATALSRRRLVQRLLLAGSPWVAPAAAAGRRRTVPASEGDAQRLQIGIAEPAGSGRLTFARQFAERLGRRLQRPIGIRLLSAREADEGEAWLLAAPGAPRLLLASRWHATEPWPGSARSIAVLAREPLVLLASRQLPPGLAAVRAGARASAFRWRCGIDASDEAARSAAGALLQALGLTPAVEPVDFRGATLLLPAIVGGRIELAMRTGGVYLGSGWTPLGLDEAAGNLVDVVTPHRRGELQLLAVADRRRLPGAAEVPTLDELLGPAARPPPAGPDRHIGRCLHLLAPADLSTRLARRLASAAALVADDRP